MPDFARLSPTLAAAFLGCHASAAWTIEARVGLRRALERAEDPHAELIIRKGHEHEATCLAALRETFGDPTEIPQAAQAVRFTATAAAMERGEPLIYQAALTSGPWIGYADFLVRVEAPSSRWSWSYEPWDAKLSRNARPEQLLQIAIYGDLLVEVQGSPADHGVLMLGTGDVLAPFQIERFRLSDVRYYVRRAAKRLEAFASDIPQELMPEPCGFCGKCEWSSACEDRWIKTDHLSRIAGITKQQVRRLTTAGFPTVSMLAELSDVKVTGIAPATLFRLTQQARLQKQTESSGDGAFELLDAEPGAGFDRLPLPDEGDLFFDFEGDPMTPGGLEYLCGVLWKATKGEQRGNILPGRPDHRFMTFWAHDRDQEKQAFSHLMQFLAGHLACYPQAHLYHYAAYEKTALRRLASMHAVMEAEVDDLLRAERMVDLYRVVRDAIRIGEPSYSIKSLERFYMPARETAVMSGGDSLVIYDRYRETGDQSLLDAIEDYNRDDCLSTLLLRDWLITKASKGERWPPPSSGMPASGLSRNEADIKSDHRRQVESEQASVEADLTRDPDAPDAAARRLMADLLGFHQREAKPGWWAFFDRQERSTEELIDDDECLGGCVADGRAWISQEKRSLTYRYSYPEQETKLREGADVHIAATGELAGSILVIDETTRTVTIKRGAKKEPLPQSLSLIPGGPLKVDVIRDAVWAVGRDMAKQGQQYPHVGALLRREPPRLKGLPLSAPIMSEGDRDDPGRTLEAAKRAVLALDRSWLVIQGPPGAGKTYTISHLILALLDAGKTVGVASNSHKAIDNVLHAVESRLTDAGRIKRVIGQKKDSGDEGFEGQGYIQSVTANADVDPKCPIIGGTAWLFARPELMASRDVLFIDEAGQVSLGNVVAMAQASRSIVLVGDQMQLGQPIQGSHPRDSGLSSLEYLLEGHAVVPPARGIFLSKTWRMHPHLCEFISDAVYEGELKSEDGCARQKLILDANAHSALKPVGLSFVPVEHIGCRQRSNEEAEAVKALFENVLQQQVIDRAGSKRAIQTSDILVVAPYNLQINLLRAMLPDGARVGTVDKFQGQEAEVVLISMATSGADDMPRDASFLLSRNRLNVAISRARCLAVLFASPALLDLVASNIDEMKLANTFCWAAEFALEGNRRSHAGPRNVIQE